MLPKLPRILNKKEAKITPLVMKWFMKNSLDSCAVEVKIKGNKALPHQKLALKKVHTGAFGYKIPDQGTKNPFDFFILKNACAYVVTCDGHKCEAVDPDGKSFKFKI